MTRENLWKNKNRGTWKVAAFCLSRDHIISWIKPGATLTQNKYANKRKDWYLTRKSAKNAQEKSPVVIYESLSGMGRSALKSLEIDCLKILRMMAFDWKDNHVIHISSSYTETHNIFN